MVVREARGFVCGRTALPSGDGGEGFEDEGVAGCRVRVETDLLALDRSPTPELEATLADLARHPPMAGVRIDEESRKVTLVSSLFVHEALAPFFVPRLAVAAVLQATYAELGAETLARATGFPPRRSPTRPPAPVRTPTACSGSRPSGSFPRATGPPVCGSRRAPFLGGRARARGAKAVARPDGLNARFPFAANAGDPLPRGTRAFSRCAPASLIPSSAAASSFGSSFRAAALFPRAGGHLRREAAERAGAWRRAFRLPGLRRLDPRSSEPETDLRWRLVLRVPVTSRFSRTTFTSRERCATPCSMRAVGRSGPHMSSPSRGMS